MRARIALKDRVNVQSTRMVPFIVAGEVRYRLTVSHGLGCRSDFVFDEAGLTAHIKEITGADTVAQGLVMERISA